MKTRHIAKANRNKSATSRSPHFRPVIQEWGADHAAQGRAVPIEHQAIAERSFG